MADSADVESEADEGGIRADDVTSDIAEDNSEKTAAASGDEKFDDYETLMHVFEGVNVSKDHSFSLTTSIVCELTSIEKLKTAKLFVAQLQDAIAEQEIRLVAEEKFEEEAREKERREK
jgi:hypothetical protein